MPDADPISRLNAALEGRYRIERKLGEGGMATVYLADDLRHERKVALKVLKPELAAVVGAERFLAEIKTTANLQHPHILPLFDSGEADSFLFYVMPYVEGESLRERLDREHQLPVDEAVQIAKDVAEALQAAHDRGVVHRDVKPANILLSKGRPLVSDFGIALAVGAAGGGRLTETGLSLGTPHYMSPEQATGDLSIGAASDIYALGCVLYEMLAGDPPYTASTPQAILGKIVTGQADPVRTHRKSVPRHVDAAIAKALEKVPADRFASIAALATALDDEHFRHGEELAAEAAAGPLKRLMFLGWGGAALFAGAFGWLLLQTPNPGPVTRLTIPVPQGHEMMDFLPNLALSPDGRTIVYFEGDTLYKHVLDRSEPETYSVEFRACCPFFSPDGQWIVFSDVGHDLWGMATEGGPVVDLATRTIDTDLVYTAQQMESLRRRAGETASVRLTVLDSARSEGLQVWPQLLPGGTHVLSTVTGPSGMWNDARVVVEEIGTGARTTIAEGRTYGRYLPTGHVVSIDADGTLEAVAYDVKRHRLAGEPFTVETGVRTSYWGGAASFAISETGTLAYIRGSSWAKHQLTWFDRAGNVIEEVGEPATIEGVRLSTDSRYAATYVASNSADISLFDLSTGDPQRLALGPETEDGPVWSADGRRLAYRKGISLNDHRLYAIDVPRGEPEELYADTQIVAPRSWSRDGRWLAASFFGDGSSFGVIDLDDRSVRMITEDAGNDGGSFSPDGRWLAYTSSETGVNEVYVIAFPEMGRPIPVSRGGGELPEWSRESGELFYVKGDTMMVSDVITAGDFFSSPPRPLFVSSDLRQGYWYGVTADGQRFLLQASNPDAAAREIQVVLNWFEHLKAMEGN